MPTRKEIKRLRTALNRRGVRRCVNCEYVAIVPEDDAIRNKELQCQVNPFKKRVVLSSGFCNKWMKMRKSKQNPPQEMPVTEATKTGKGVVTPGEARVSEKEAQAVVRNVSAGVNEVKKNEEE